MAKDVIITPADGDIQFENATGTEAGKIEQSGDDLVLSNAVGDILIGDGTTDVYIGDGAANVDIVFEQNGSIRGEAGSSVDITLGSSDTDVIISGSTFNINPDASFTSNVTANSFIKDGGASTEFLKADGSVDTSTYLTTLPTHNHDGRYLRTHTRYSDDLDTITTSGVYIWDVSEADDEPTGASDGILTIKYWDSTNWATANFQDFHTNKLYIKSKQSNTWQTDWARVWTTDQLSDTVKGQYDTAYTYSQVGHLPLAGGTLTGNLTVDIADDGGAPAMTSTLRLKGYEGRGAGIKIQDSVNSATSSSDREWFIGSGYSTSGFNIGYAGDGVQSSYAAQSFFDISTSGNAVFAGRVKGENFTSTENAAPGGFQASRDYLIAGTGDRGGGIVINDISGARYGFYAGGHDLTFAKETDDGAGTVSHDIWMRANATNGAGNVNSIEFFKESSFSGNVTIDGNVKPNLLELIDQNNSTSTADFRMYGWGTELQFTKRNLSTGAHTGTLLALDYTSNAATFLGAITASNFSGTSSGTNTGDQDLSGYLTSLPSHNHDDRYYTETEINENLASLQGWVPAYSNTEGSSVRWNFTEDALQIQLDTDTTTGASFKARRIISGERIRVTIMAKASAAASSGVYFRLYQHNGDMPDGKTHVSNDASNSSVLVQEDDAGVTSWHENSSITTDWVTYEKEYTAVADGYISLVILNWSDLGTNSLYIKNPDIQTIKAATAATVTTNANLTGHVTSVGNATSLGSFTTAELNAAISDGTINTPDLSGYLPLAAGSGSPLTGNLHIPDYLYHAGDTNTYLRFRAADDVELVAGGRNVIRMDEGTDPDKVQLGDSTTVTYTEGRLGIGTATPTQTDVGSIVPKLHVKQSDTTGAFNLIARFQAGGDANETGGAILINHSNDRGLLIEGGRGGEGAIADDDAVSHFGLIQSNGTNTRVMTLRQKSVSNSTLFGVGIGTTTPQQKLHVEGNIYLGPNNTNNFVHSGANLGLQADGEVKIVSDVNDIAGGGASDIIFGYGSSTDTDSNQDFTEAELSTYPRVEVMRIDVSTNRVGIGTATPQQSLSVDGGNIGLGLGAEVYGIIAPNNTNFGLDFIIGDGAASGDTPIMSLKSNGGQPEGTVQIYGSGSTVLDIQGTSGQLFSITDDLTGDLFTVSDISGVPIFNVNASGLVTVDGNLNLGDNDKIQFGASQDLQIYHDGSNSYISETGTGRLILSGGSDIQLKSPAGELMADFNGNGSVDLYYDNSKKFETTSTGVSVIGNIVMAANATVDGVDISALPTTFAPTNAEQNVQSDWNATSGDALILNKPTIPTDHGDHDGLYLPIGGGIITGDLTVNGKVTQAGDVDREEWGRTYAASNTTIATLLTSDGSALPTGGGYRMTGHIAGTGTDQVSVAVFWNEDGTWYCNNTFAGGTSSNHIEFLISGGVPKVKTWHSNNYSIVVTHERLSLNEGTGNDNLRGYFGADSFLKWTESTNALVVPGTIAATGTLTVDTGLSGTGDANRGFTATKTDLGAVHAAGGEGGTSASADTTPMITIPGSTAGQVQGGIYASQNSSTGTSISIFTTDSYSTGPQQSLTIFDSGNVSVGRGNLKVHQAANNGNTGAFIDPHIKLTASATADSTGFVGIAAATSTSDNYGYSFGAQRTSGGVGDFKINYHNNSAAGTNRFIIDQSGNVGIVTTNPGEKLTVKGTDNYIATEQTSYPWGGANTLGVKMGTDGTAGLLDFRRWTGSSAIHGTAVITQINADGGYGLDFRVDQKTTNTRATTSRMFISTSGEVGIGITDPSDKLEVDGNIKGDSFSSDGNARSYTWRALQNTSGGTNFYHRIARITGTQSTRFIIELAGRFSSYSDGSVPAYGKLVGQLNNDNNYDLVYYDFTNGVTGTSQVVTKIGQVDVNTLTTDIYINNGQFSEITATAHISDGSITPYDSSNGSTSAPAGYTDANTATVWNSTNNSSLVSSLISSFPKGSTTNYTSAATSNSDAWYKLFQIQDNNSCPIECHIRSYAHTSLSFIASEGYAGGDAHINILDAHVSSVNNGYKYIEGIRITASGVVEILLNGGSNVAVEMTLIGDAIPESSLVISTETSANIKDSVTSLSTGMIRTYGDVTVGENLSYTKPTANNQFRGEIVTFGSQSSIATGDIVYLNTSGQWAKAQANSGATSKSLLGVAMGSTAAAGILLRGFVRSSSSFSVSLLAGLPFYLSTGTAGDAQASVPTATGHIARILGYATGVSAEMYFCPDNTFVEIA